MKVKFYLKVSSAGNVTVSKKEPYVKQSEVAISCNLDLPTALFKRPTIEATINVNADDINPFVIDAETANTVKDAIIQSTGLDIKLTISKPEDHD